MEESHQEARVGAAPAGINDIGISRLPSPRAGRVGTAVNIWVHSQGQTRQVGAWSAMTQLSWDMLHPRWYQQAYSQMHLLYYNHDVGFLPATRSAKTISWLRAVPLQPSRASWPHLPISQTLHSRIEFIWLTRKTTSQSPA